jgi:hypothetical protein
MQIAAVQEAVPGTLEAGLFASANMKYLVIDPTIDYDIPLFERDYKRASLTSIEGLAGLKTGSFRFQLEMAGHAHATPDIPVWDLFMKSCGFVSKATTTIDTTAMTNAPLRHGDVVTATGTGASGTATVVHDTYPDGTGESTLYLADDNITWASGSETTLTSALDPTTTATCADGNSSSDAGQSWWPTNEQTISMVYTGSVTGTISAGEIFTMGTTGAAGIVVSHDTVGKTIIARIYNAIMPVATETLTTAAADSVSIDGAIAQDNIPSLSVGLIEDGVDKQLSGVRGNWSMEANVGEPAIMTFEFQGKAEAPADQALVDESTIAYESAVPPVLLSAAAIFGTEGDSDNTGDYSPRFGSLGLNLNNDVNPRIDANQATGILEHLITGRAATGSFDPEIDLETSYPLLENFRQGLVMRSKFEVGTVAANRFYCTIPGMQATGMNSGERAGVSNRAYEFRASGGHASNSGDALRSDNEIIITYLL